MPTYDYNCLKCNKAFSITENITAHGTHTVRCPHCNSKSVERVFQSFFAVTAKKN